MDAGADASVALSLLPLSYILAEATDETERTPYSKHIHRCFSINYFFFLSPALSAARQALAVSSAASCTLYLRWVSLYFASLVCMRLCIKYTYSIAVSEPDDEYYRRVWINWIAHILRVYGKLEISLVSQRYARTMCKYLVITFYASRPHFHFGAKTFHEYAQRRDKFFLNE